jgi:hypothetical protein
MLPNYPALLETKRLHKLSFTDGIEFILQEKKRKDSQAGSNGLPVVQSSGTEPA